MTEREQKIDNLAQEVLRLARNTLLVHLRFLDAALSQFILQSATVPLATNGRDVYYNPQTILQAYKAERERPVRDYLHMVLHCVFHHNFVDTLLDTACWDLACDIAVESVVTQLDLPVTASSRQARQTQVLVQLKAEAGGLTAEKLYRYYMDRQLSPAELAQLRALFFADSHEIWYLPPEKTIPSTGQTSGDHNSQSDDTPGGNSDTQDDSGSSGGGSQDRGEKALSRAALAQIWADISQRMQMDLETFSRQRGDQAGDLLQNLRAVNREKYDYTAFLKKFAVPGEAMKINPDEFDYIFYTYGMSLYGNMPLIEPLEYREIKRIREFVLAIDTSGSTSGELVQKFVQKTYNILKSTESFFSKINLHIIQCDADIQEDVKITSQEEFDAYLKTMTIKGLGGTDFRPVFRYVDELIRKGEFANLKGLIYFTDGYGDFPEKKPDYDAAFVFVEDEYNNPDVPPWAIKLVLQKDEI